MAREIEEDQFAHYVKLDVKKIEAVHGLDQLVSQSQIKKERGQYVRQKFEDLRALLGRRLMDEKKTVGECEDFVDQLKRGKEELRKLLKASEEDAVALELVKEDAEQADGEANLAREREQNLLLESSELMRIRDDYKKKIEEIEHDYHEALAPVIGRMQLEIKTAGQEIVDDLAKSETTTEEIEQAKQKLEQVTDELKVVKNNLAEVHTKLGTLEGQPERYRKQSDIFLNALVSVRAQDAKWGAKVKEVEAAIQSLNQSAREKTEEHARLMLNFDKFKLLAEEKERTCTDVQKDIETTNLEVDQSLGDRVQLDVQLMGKMSELKHQTDILANTVKDRDRAILKLKEKEGIVAKIQGMMPIFIQEKEKTQREFAIAESLLKKVQERLEQIRKDVDVSMKSLLLAEKLGKQVNQVVRESHAKVQELEEEVVSCTENERQRTQHITELTNVRERLARSAAAKYAQWRETKDKVRLQENFMKNFEKRVVEIERQYKDALALYNLVRSQQNKFASFVMASAVTIEEIKDKVTTLSKEVEQFQGEVLYKEKVLAKMRAYHEIAVKGRGMIREDITKCTQVVKAKKSIVEEQELEIISLEDIINRAERDMVRARKTYGLSVKDRNKVGISLIDRSDELCILYEKSNVQEELLRHSEVELAKRIDEIDTLKRECNLTHKSILTQHRATPNPDAVYRELASLKEQMEKASTDVIQLSELVEKPSNLDRWRVLPGRDNNYTELTQKALAIEEFLSAKEDQAYEKDLVLEEVSVLAEDMLRKAALSRPESIKIGQKMNGYVRHLGYITRQLMATVSELSLVQATAITMKQEKVTFQLNVDEAYQRLAKRAGTQDFLVAHRICHLRIENMSYSYVEQHDLLAVNGSTIEAAYIYYAQQSQMLTSHVENGSDSNVNKMQPPTADIDKLYQSFLRQNAVVRKIKGDRELLRLEDEKEREAQVHKKPQ